MKFSIVVPVYNAKKYITDCCDSVFCQNYQNYELILVDDGSTDGSGLLCDKILNQAPDRVKVLHTTNNGPLLARIAGIRASTGDVIVSLDADDCLHCDLLKKLEQCFTEYKCDLVLYNASKNSDYSSKDSYFAFESEDVCSVVQKYDYIYKMVLSEVPNSLCMKAATRECFESLPDFSEYSHVKNGDDLLISLYMISAAEKILYMNDVLYYYRQHAESIVHSFNPNRTNSIKTVHREFERFIDLWNIPELHPYHYAREVNGWIYSLLILMDNRNTMSTAAFSDNLISMANDDYFLRAYESMNPEKLDRTYRVLAKWLYQKRFFLLRLAAFIRSIIRKVKQ